MSNTTMTREEKLNHLIEIMKKEETAANLNMDKWYEIDEEKPCGYAACAFGNAGLDPLFNMMGLQVNTAPVGGGDFILNGEDFFSGFGVAQDFFELTPHESYYLFDPEEYYSCCCLEWMFDNVLDYADRNEPDRPYTDYCFVVEDGYDFEENPEGLEITPQMVINHIILVRDHPELFVR